MGLSPQIPLEPGVSVEFDHRNWRYLVLPMSAQGLASCLEGRAERPSTGCSLGAQKPLLENWKDKGDSKIGLTILYHKGLSPSLDSTPLKASG